MIYKIFRPDEYEHFINTGQSQGSPDDVRDGFIHFSTKDQLEGTLRKHFSDEDNLYILGCDEKGFSQLKWEKSRNNALFPHLYEILKSEHIAQTWFMPSHEIPDELTSLKDEEDKHAKT